MKPNFTYSDMVSLENLLGAWQGFLIGKRKKMDVQEFQVHLMDNLITLHTDLVRKMYRHGGYQAFKIQDPKPRDIHKAAVRDRLVHHAIYRKLYPEFDKTFITDSFSCRLNKGTHRAMNRFQSMAHKVSQNHTRTCWVLKLDIRKFFASIDHKILKRILSGSISDQEILWLINEIIDSFNSKRPGVGLPLGNLTSQLFVNIYMNEFDQFVKHNLKEKHYIRYADDFVILSEDRDYLLVILTKLDTYLQDHLHLRIHPKKIALATFASGVDFLGWVHFVDHRTLRTSSKRRMYRRLSESPTKQTYQSYIGLLSHGNTEKLRRLVY
ncbi:MAG: hypothetical protein HQ488_04710 [Parcubacteria group bacterium]|nr:hypothetical protein [Parcubacteria group bacterium]